MAEQKPTLSFEDALSEITGKSAESAPLSFEDALKAVRSEPTKPSEGYWEDRGIAGKVWHPASGVTERGRSDNQVLGFPPELAAIGAARIGAPLVQGGIDTATKVATGAKAAAGMLGPIVKYEAVKHGLQALGVPWWAAEGAGIVASGMRGGAKTAEEAAATEAVAVPKGEPALSPLELTRKMRAEHQAATGATKLPSPNPIAPSVEAPLKLKLNVEEAAAALKMRASKQYTDQQIENVIRAARELKMRFGLPSDATVADIVKKANETGRMTR